ncbi:MAG: hypothetical protein LBU34_09325 [Planctomycetaceae bacterium]|nr:hypothetical protein [Planctomycetaceae bacterium]
MNSSRAEFFLKGLSSRGRRRFTNLTINNSQGRQSLGESPSPSDCVGVSRQ